MKNKKQQVRAEEPPGKLRFNYAQIATELEVFEPIAAHCLSDASVQALKLWQDQLSRTASIGKKQICKVATKAIISTKSNDGDHDNSPGKPVFGEMEVTWDVIPEVSTASRIGAKAFLLDNASIRIRILKEVDGSRTILAKWTFDIGNQESPGCHFHAKYEDPASSDTDSVIPIPRLPTFVVMPTDAMAFLFGELWQGTWSGALQSDLREPAKRWRSWPRERLVAVLAAFGECIEKDDGLIPWAAFKAYKPKNNLLLK